MKSKIITNTAYGILTLVVSLFFFTQQVYAQAAPDAAPVWNGYTFVTPPPSTSTTTTPPTGPTAYSSTSGLQYTGSYCQNFSATLQLSSANLGDLFHFATCLIEVSIVPLLFAVAVTVFVYGVVKFISTEESAEKEGGRQFMIWGIVALAVMFSIWGLVKVLNTTFGVSNVIPQLPVGVK